jgi:hypothetical protein
VVSFQWVVQRGSQPILQMKTQLNRRDFVKTSALAAAAFPALVQAGPGNAASASPPPGAVPAQACVLPMGRIGEVDFSRLMLGGNLISGHSHSRDLRYVATLMRRYNTEAKIAETLEIAEANGINVINTWVMDDNSHIFKHWKRGGKIKWISQARLDGNGGFSQFRRAVDEGAVAVHITGDTAEGLLAQGKFEKVSESVALIHSLKRVAGVAAHDFRVVMECERLKLDADFYQATFHSHDYFTAPKAGETNALGENDNSWCSNPQQVVDFMRNVKKPWIAFKILAAGALPPRTAFPYAINSGADFILVGMFDWQIEENAKLAKRIIEATARPDSSRTRAWHGSVT